MVVNTNTYNWTILWWTWHSTSIFHSIFTPTKWDCWTEKMCLNGVYSKYVPINKVAPLFLGRGNFYRGFCFQWTNNGNIEYCLGIKIKCDWVCKIFLLFEKYTFMIFCISSKWRLTNPLPLLFMQTFIIPRTWCLLPMKNKEQWL